MLSGLDYKGSYGVIARPKYYVAGYGDYIQGRLEMNYDVYEDPNTVKYYSMDSTIDRYERTTTRISANDFRIASAQIGIPYGGVYVEYEYSYDDGDPGTQYTWLTFSSDYKRDRTSGGYSAYSGWDPVNLDAGGTHNLYHHNEFWVNWDNKLQYKIDNTDCQLPLRQ